MKKPIESIRADLKKAAPRQPEAMQPFINKLSTQLRNYASGNAEDRAVLRPKILDSVGEIKGVCGR